MQPVPFFSRLLLAWGVFFRLLADGLFAARVAGVRELPAPPAPAEPVEKVVEVEKLVTVEKIVELEKVVERTVDSPTSALLLVAALQREGRLLDFLAQPLDGLSDAEIGAVARIVHGGCKKALGAAIPTAPILAGEEGTKASAAELPDAAVTLLGAAATTREGTLVHRGWKATATHLPTLAPGHDPTWLHPAELEG